MCIHLLNRLHCLYTTAVAVSVRTGGRLPVAVVLVLGFSNIFADALSMGVGEYLSSKVRPACPRTPPGTISDKSTGKGLYSVVLPSSFRPRPRVLCLDASSCQA